MNVKKGTPVQDLNKRMEELNEALEDLTGEVWALQSLLTCGRSPVEERARKAFLLRLRDYIDQHARDIRALSEMLVREAVDRK